MLIYIRQFKVENANLLIFLAGYMVEYFSQSPVYILTSLGSSNPRETSSSLSLASRHLGERGGSEEEEVG